MEKVNPFEELEQERKKVYNKSRLEYGSAIALFILGMALFFFISFFTIFFFIGAIALIFIAARTTKQFKDKFKDLVVKKIVKEELGKEAVYKIRGGISIKEIVSLDVVASPDRYHTEDYISCSYNNVPYEMCDCVLEERHVSTDSNGHQTEHYQTYFKGRVIKIDFQRELNMELKVVNKPTKGFKAGSLVKFETEVIDFNKKFKCYASSKEDGFYLLTPIMIQKMLELEKMYAGGIYYVVKHNNLYVLINNSGDSLEVNISKPLDSKQIDRIRYDLWIAATIINEFRVDSDKFNVNR
ncbi:MAG: DUF3137 domain-containing protein [Anaeroplasmataceae bacterium]|nr:DUF3137 domain-containing protein [Anaeroplasmataceae bacterium]